MQATTIAQPRAHAASASKRSRLLMWLLALGALFLLLGAAVYFADEPTRRYTESELNRRLDGYSVEVPGLSLHLLQLSVTISGLTIRQEAHPEPAVLVLRELDFGVDWRALLRARLVGSFALTEPQLHINRTQLQAESADPVDLADKGWQHALDVFLLEVNRLTVENGSMTYIDADPKRPLRLTQTNLLATNLRKIRDAETEYPSELHLDAVVFDEGALRIDGRADLLAEPYPGVDADIDLERVPLEKLGPLASQANIRIKGGVLSASGRVEAAPKGENVHLRRATVDGLDIGYVHSRETQEAEARRLAKLEKAAEDLSNRRQLAVRIDEMQVRNSTLAYIDEMKKPPYRLFLSDALVEVRGLSNVGDAGMADVKVVGNFQGAGPSWLVAKFAQRQEDPDLDIMVQVERTPLKRMNDVLRRYGKFDVAAGEFSYYSQLRIKDGRIDGYAKPFFADIDVYDERQDAEKALFRQLYEGLVGGVATLLENRHDQVATDVAVRGEAKQPKVSTWQAVVNMVRNAFFDAVLPGFDKAMSDSGTG